MLLTNKTNSVIFTYERNDKVNNNIFIFIIFQTYIYYIEREVVNMDIDYDVIGKRIKQARMKKGLSQENLADELDISTAFLSRVETGKSQINLRRLLQVGKVLDVPPEELISGTYIYSERYLDREMSDILLKCSPKAQQLIYKMADLIANMQLV